MLTDTTNPAAVPLTNPTDGVIVPTIPTNARLMPKEPIQTSKSWLLLLIFAYYQILASFALNGYYSVGDKVAVHYNVPLGYITGLQVGCYALCALKFPAMYVGDKYGMI